MPRKLKAALSIGALWGIAHGALGAVIGGLIGLSQGSFLGSALAFGAGGAAIGLVLGAGFGGLLSLMEGRRTLGELTARRAAFSGFVAGATVAAVGVAAVATLTGAFGLAGSGLGLPLVVQLTAFAGVSACYGSVAAGLAAGTVSIAKRSPPPLLTGPDASAQDLRVGG